MAGDVRSGRTPWPAASDYLRGVDAGLARLRWSRRAMLAELADGLTDAVEHYQARGVSTSQAVSRALRDSAPPPPWPAQFPKPWPLLRLAGPLSPC